MSRCNTGPVHHCRMASKSIVKRDAVSEGREGGREGWRGEGERESKKGLLAVKNIL